MERFKKIDWAPALEDILEDVFIKDERLERESAMYKIMRDDFRDPFADIEQDYANVNMELIKKFLAEDPLTESEEEEEQNTSSTKKKKISKKKHIDADCNQKQESRSYVPGIRKLPFNFPKRSCLTKIQQSMCLRVLLKLFSNEQKGLSKEEQLELESYIVLKDKILEEQKEFLNFAKSKWDDSFNWQIKYNKFIISKWNAKMQKLQKLPRYYIEIKNISLSMQKINSVFNKSIEIKFISCLHQLGLFSKVIWPNFDRPSMLHVNPAILFNNYQCVTPNNVTQHFRLPVSDDTYCEHLAIETKADFVISSSGLKCLLNIDSNYLNSWLIPVVVKSHNGKNVIYIDKRIPPNIATIPQKNTWVYKYILRHCFVDINNETFKEKMQHTKENKSENAATYSNLDNIDSECSTEFNDYLKIYEEDLYFSDKQKLKNSDNPVNDNETNNTEINVTYKLFTIGPTEFLNHEVGKHDVKEYQMLVRTKTDGIEVLPNKKSQYVMLTPKMEHQLGFGAEAVTFEELSHQWASLIFRPNTSLARVRITADTSEIIQIEKHTTVSLSNEMRRLYNVKIEDSLSILHNIIEELSSLTPGRYILRHVPQRGPFVYVHKQVEEPGKNVFDLHMVRQSAAMFQTVPKTPWPLIDTILTTPAIRFFKKMPAMFNAFYQSSNRPRGRPKKNIDSTSAVRRSLRLKKK